jgi:type III secretion protein J
MVFLRRYGLLFLLILCLSGCKVELYSGLSEPEANQMLALLMLRNIESEKRVIKEGNIIVMVNKDQFMEAVETLRQHGLPSRRTETMNDLFPPGQLVTSPVQEQAKINYLKEQLLEKMLSDMDGIVSAQVSIAENVTNNRREIPIPSASVFIKYTPAVNIPNLEGDIRSLILNGIPNLRTDKISVVLQATDYRYQASSMRPTQPMWLRGYVVWPVLALIFTIVMIILVVIVWNRRKASS